MMSAIKYTLSAKKLRLKKGEDFENKADFLSVDSTRVTML